MEIEIVERKSGKKNEKRKRNSVRKKCGSGKKKVLEKVARKFRDTGDRK